MAVLGVSVYPDIRPMAEIADYLRLAAKYGFTRVFSSMFSVEGTPEEVLALFRELDEVAHECGMEVSLDINPECMDRLGATPTDLSVFAGIDVDILRMDGAYGEDDNVAMLKNPYGMKIEYNASALTPQEIESLVNRGVDKDRILACHNFYPQRYTGFRWDKFLAVNERLGKLGIRVGAFISSHAPGTHGVWDATCGLPTVERLRDYPADLQARIMAATDNVTDIFFGNAYASEEEFAAVAAALAPAQPTFLNEKQEHDLKNSPWIDYDKLISKVRRVRIEPLADLTEVEHEILFDFFPHLDMGDSSEWMWRSRSARVYYQDQVIAPRRYAAAEFPVGSVLMVNDAYKHYAGEVQVVLEPMVNDGTRNLVGRIDEQEMRMFEVISDGDLVEFLPIR